MGFRLSGSNNEGFEDSGQYACVDEGVYITVNMDPPKTRPPTSNYTALETRMQQHSVLDDTRYTDLPTVQSCRPPEKPEEPEKPPEVHRRDADTGCSGYLCTRASYWTVPAQVLDKLSKLAKHRDLGFIRLNKNGGVYEMFKSASKAKQQESVVVMASQGTVENTTRLVAIKSRNPEDFPKGIPKENTLSDVIHLLPHEQIFLKPITVRIRLKSHTISPNEVTLLHEQ